MIFNGKPFVPPTCPQQHNDMFDITAESFNVGYDHDGGLVVDVFAYFAYRRGYTLKGAVETEGIEVPINSRVAELFRRMVNGDKKLEERLRKLLLERISKCQGIKRGECWALGAAGFDEVLKKLS